MLGAVSGVVHFFGRLSFLVDENAHAVHFFISALLQLLDRCARCGECGRGRQRAGRGRLPAGRTAWLQLHARLVKRRRAP